LLCRARIDRGSLGRRSSKARFAPRASADRSAKTGLRGTLCGGWPGGSFSFLSLIEEVSLDLLRREVPASSLVVAIDPGKALNRVWLTTGERGLIGEPVSLPVLRDGVDELERLIAGSGVAGPPVIGLEATGGLHRAWAAEIERRWPGSLRLLAPSETPTVRQARPDDPQAPRRDPRRRSPRHHQRARRSAQQHRPPDRPPRLRLSLSHRRPRADHAHLRTDRAPTPTRTSPTSMTRDPKKGSAHT
jgi:hypothetical protein